MLFIAWRSKNTLVKGGTAKSRGQGERDVRIGISVHRFDSAERNLHSDGASLLSHFGRRVHNAVNGILGVLRCTNTKHPWSAPCSARREARPPVFLHGRETATQPYDQQLSRGCYACAVWELNPRFKHAAASCLTHRVQQTAWGRPRLMP